MRREGKGEGRVFWRQREVMEKCEYLGEVRLRRRASNLEIKIW